MNVAVAAIIIGAIISLTVGLVTSLVALLPVKQTDDRRRPIVMRTGPIYWSFAGWTVVLGVVLMLAPQFWYGPSWSYFAAMIPHNGFGMGLCCTGLGVLLMFALWRGAGARILSILFFLNGFVYWTAGIILGAEGLLGHQGLMETPFMLIVGAHAFALSASLMAYTK